ncbi:MAG: potassium channel family protein [Planctomycetota bacterium]
MRTFSVIGLGTFGLALARELARLGAQVTAVDNERGHVERVKDEVHTAVRMDARDREALEEQRIHAVDCAVVCMGEDFEASEVCAVHLLDLGCPRVLVRGTSRERVEILEALGPEVITPGLRSAGQWAARLMGSAMVDYASLVGGHDVALARVPEGVAGTLGDLKIARKTVRVLALRRGDEVHVGPGEEQDLVAGDELFLLGSEADLIHAVRGFREPTRD